MKKTSRHVGMSSLTVAAVATSLCAALGVDARQAMAAEDTPGHPEVAGQNRDATQMKWVTTKQKQNATQVKLHSSQGKIISTQGKVVSTQGKIVSTQGKIGAVQGKIEATQGKVDPDPGKR
jgi:peptidoglycan hydrolase CwlO-like protein